jgi:hypothetical protein
MNKSEENARVATTDRGGTKPISIAKMVVVKIRLYVMFMIYPFTNFTDFNVKK